jgi:hypothetical protein
VNEAMGWATVKCTKCGNDMAVPKKKGKIPSRKYHICGFCWEKQRQTAQKKTKERL